MFWLVEAYLFLTFFYLLLNASAEPTYFFDYAAISKTHLFSFRIFFFRLALISMLISVCYYIVSSLSVLSRASVLVLCFIASALLSSMFFVEFLQFFHFLSFSDSLGWHSSKGGLEWSLGVEEQKTRVLNSYVTLCVVVKFMHIAFILVFWFFSVNRLIERPDSRESLMSANLQNFIILYFLNWLSMYPWLKYMLRKYLSFAYSSFGVSDRGPSLRYFFSGLESCLLGLF